MKNNIQKVLGVLVTVILICSCNDIVHYNDNYEDQMHPNGVPVIDGIYDAKDDSNSTRIYSGDMEQMIKVVGSNLGEAIKITVNGVDVDMNEVYATNSVAWFSIPRDVPDNPDGLLIYVTTKGEVSVEFNVNIPPLQLDGLYNEFAFPGDTVQVLGRFFDLYRFGVENSTSTVTMNGNLLEIGSVSPTYLSIVIPESAQENSKIEFAWSENGINKTKVFNYRNVSGILISDFYNAGLWSDDMKKYIIDDPNAVPVHTYGEQYLKVTGKYDAWSWNQIFGGGFDFDNEDVINAPEDYLFKFEVYSASTFPFYDSESAGYQFNLNNSSQYAWNPSSAVSFNTYGKWRTVSIPLASVASNGLTNGWIAFSFVMQPNSAWDVDHAFSNFRIEKIEP